MLDKLQPNPKNPRLIKRAEFVRLKKKIQEFPEMLEKRPIIYDENFVVLGGNQRLRALKELAKEGFEIKDSYFKSAEGWTEEQKRKFVILDNIADGEWQWEQIANEWSDLPLEEWGLDPTQWNELEIQKIDEKPIKDIKDIKILNLYAGIGGNRALWGEDVRVTAIEYDEKIAKVYKDYFSNDEVIVDDAHAYLEKNFDKFDFIWTSPPCPTHSRMRKNFVGSENDKQNKPIYPDMRLWQEILFLQGYFKGKWIVENVITWYDPLIEPQERGRHYYWSNFNILESSIFEKKEIITIDRFRLHDKNFNFDLSKYEDISKTQKNIMMRNMVHPEVGKFILECAYSNL